ncbi:hypothetical protein L573_1086 [Bordetella holmesii H620]|nr:hypothetical protein L573_1086 [Bordetella holmesii H620]
MQHARHPAGVACLILGSHLDVSRFQVIVGLHPEIATGVDIAGLGRVVGEGNHNPRARLARTNDRHTPCRAVLFKPVDVDVWRSLVYRVHVLMSHPRALVARQVGRLDLYRARHDVLRRFCAVTAVGAGPDLLAGTSRERYRDLGPCLGAALDRHPARLRIGDHASNAWWRRRGCIRSIIVALPGLRTLVARLVDGLHADVATDHIARRGHAEHAIVAGNALSHRAVRETDGDLRFRLRLSAHGHTPRGRIRDDGGDRRLRRRCFIHAIVEMARRHLAQIADLIFGPDINPARHHIARRRRFVAAIVPRYDLRKRSIREDDVNLRTWLGLARDREAAVGGIFGDGGDDGRGRGGFVHDIHVAVSGHCALIAGSVRRNNLDVPGHHVRLRHHPIAAVIGSDHALDRAVREVHRDVCAPLGPPVDSHAAGGIVGGDKADFRRLWRRGVLGVVISLNRNRARAAVLPRRLGSDVAGHHVASRDDLVHAILACHRTLRGTVRKTNVHACAGVGLAGHGDAPGFRLGDDRLDSRRLHAWRLIMGARAYPHPGLRMGGLHHDLPLLDLALGPYLEHPLIVRLGGDRFAIRERHLHIRLRFRAAADFQRTHHGLRHQGGNRHPQAARAHFIHVLVAYFAAAVAFGIAGSQHDQAGGLILGRQVREAARSVGARNSRRTIRQAHRDRCSRMG